jgi:hypothetical protein
MPMSVPPPGRSLGESGWRPRLGGQGVGHLVSAGPEPDGWPVIVPTRFVLEGAEVLTHVAAAHPHRRSAARG